MRINILNSNDVVLEFLAIDMAWHTNSGLTEFKHHQAHKLVESLTAEHQPTLVAEMKELSQLLDGTPNQLFVQAFLTMELVDRAVQTATLYYSQRIPEELGQFDWLPGQPRAQRFQPSSGRRAADLLGSRRQVAGAGKLARG